MISAKMISTAIYLYSICL